MNIASFLNEKAISANLTAKDKQGVIRELVDLLAKAGEINQKDIEKLMKILMNREALGSTGIGHGVAIPHGKSDCVKNLVASLGISYQGIDFESLDGEPAHIFFLLIAPEDSAGPHLKALARISRLLKDRFFRESLKNSKDDKALLKIIREEDQKKQ